MIPSIPERLQRIKDELGITEDTELAKMAGASKSMVNQWFSGRIKSISAQYAYKLEENTGFTSRWIQLGEGQERISKAIVHTIASMQLMEPQQQYLAARLVDQIVESKKQDAPGQ